MSDETCKSCFYVHKRNEPDPNGNPTSRVAYFCRRYPPSTIGIIRVAHDGWCGEFHKNVEDDKK